MVENLLVSRKRGARASGPVSDVRFYCATAPFDLLRLYRRVPAIARRRIHGSGIELMAVAMAL